MGEVRAFKKSFDEVLLVASILKRLSAGNLTTINERIKTQKMQYLAQIFRVSPIYSFNLYIHGPYSPDLAFDLFTLKGRNANIPVQEFVSSELEEKFLKLSRFVKNKTTRELELIATHHWLKEAGLNLRDIEKKLGELKKAETNDVINTNRWVMELPS